MRFSVLILAILSGMASAQAWNYNDIALYERDAAVLIELGQHDRAAALFEQILFLTRVNEGLYSTSAINLAFELRKYAERKRDFDEAYKWSGYVDFIVTRNGDSNSEMYRDLIKNHLYNPEDQTCFEREGVSFSNDTMDCRVERYYLADSWIKAVELQQGQVAKAIDEASELLILHDLASKAVQAVYGVDGQEMKWDGREQRMVEGDTRQKYQFRRYLRIQREALDQLMEITGRE